MRQTQYRGQRELGFGQLGVSRVCIPRASLLLMGGLLSLTVALVALTVQAAPPTTPASPKIRVPLPTDVHPVAAEPAPTTAQPEKPLAPAGQPVQQIYAVPAQPTVVTQSQPEATPSAVAPVTQEAASSSETASPASATETPNPSQPVVQQAEAQAQPSVSPPPTTGPVFTTLPLQPSMPVTIPPSHLTTPAAAQKPQPPSVPAIEAVSQPVVTQPTVSPSAEQANQPSQPVSQPLVQPVVPAPPEMTQATPQPSQQPTQTLQGIVHQEDAGPNVGWRPADFASFDLLRNVPIDVHKTAFASQIPDRLTTAQGMIELLNKTANVGIHMELIRRSFAELPETEKHAFAKAAMTRYQGDRNNPLKFFDHGYTQLVYDHDQIGLFFLRKANDKLKSPYTSLAYGIAQIEIDLKVEGVSPVDPSGRKVDATYKLIDSLTYNIDSYDPSFWSTYLRFVEQIKVLPAFNDFVNKDFTYVFVPYGTTILPPVPENPTILGPDCHVGPVIDKSQLPMKQLHITKNIPAPGVQDSTAFLDVHFFRLGPGAFRVVVMDSRGRVYGDFVSPNAPYITEDINNDGVYEFVIRQFSEHPLHPVKVYQFKDCQYQLDQRVERLFQ